MTNYPTYKLGEIAKIYNGNSINAEEKEKKYKGVDGRNYIGTKDIEFDCSVNYSNGVRIPFDEKKFKIAPTGSVLVCAEGGSAGKKSAFITEDVCFGNKLFAITNNQGLFDGKYVFYYTRYKRFFDLFKNELSGLIGGVSSKKFGEIPIPLPPLSTQHAIVTRIETLFAELDKAVQHLRTAQQQLKTYRQAVLNHWLNNEDGKWEMVKLGEVIEVKDGTHDTPKYVQSGIPFVTQKNITESGISFSNVQYITEQDHFKFHERSNVAQNDILIAMIGANRGNATIVNTDIVFSIKNVGLLKYTPNVFNNKFLLFYLRSQKSINYIKKQSKGGAQEFIGLKELRNFPVSLPPLAEQQRIVTEIESRLSQAEAAAASIEKALQQSEALRQSILKKAFSGELNL